MHQVTLIEIVEHCLDLSNFAMAEAQDEERAQGKACKMRIQDRCNIYVIVSSSPEETKTELLFAQLHGNVGSFALM